MALFFRVVLGSPRERADGAIYGMEVPEDLLRETVVAPFQAGAQITWEGRTISSRGAQITISRIDDQLDGTSLADLRTQASRGPGYRRKVGDVNDHGNSPVVITRIPHPGMTGSGAGAAGWKRRDGGVGAWRSWWRRGLGRGGGVCTAHSGKVSAIA